MSSPAPLVHRLAEFHGVQAPALRDGAAMAGLMLSAAGAAGFSTIESPIVRHLTRDGVVAVLLLDVGHLVVHSFPDRESVIVDLLVASSRDPQAAVDVFARKFGLHEQRPPRSFTRA